MDAACGLQPGRFAGVAAVYGALLVGTSALDVRHRTASIATASLAACTLWCGLGAAVGCAERGRLTVGRARR